MNRMNLTLLLCIIGGSCIAQFDNIYKRKPWLDLKKQKLKNFRPLTPETPAQPQPDNRFSAGVVNLGIIKKRVGSINIDTDLFAIEGYNMPCLSPSNKIKLSMPVAGYKSPSILTPAGK